MLTLFLIAALGWSQVTVPITAEEAVLAIERQRIDAIERQDFAAVEPLIGEEFLSTTSAGAVVDKRACMAALRSGTRRPVHVVHDEVKVRIYGDVAILTGRSTGELVIDGREQPVMVRFTHVYVRRAGGWEMVAMQTTNVAAR